MNTIPLYGPISNDTLHPGTMHQLLGGNGVCSWKQLINGMHLERNLHCVEFVLVPPGASIGLHTHDRTEEIYYLLRGGATMSVNGELRQVQAGDLLTTPIGGRHGTTNTSEQVMAFFVVEVFPGSTSTTSEPLHIPLRAQMQACTSPRSRNGTIWAASLDLSSLSPRHFCENGKMKERWKIVREEMERCSVEKERKRGNRTASRNKEGKQRVRVNEHPMRSSYQYSHTKGQSQWKLRRYYGKNGMNKSRDCSRWYMDISKSCWP